MQEKQDNGCDEERKRVRFYGAVTVSDRGQIVVPAEARRDLGIEVGEKLLAVSGPGGWLIFIPASILGEMLAQWADVARLLTDSSILDNKMAVEEMDETES
ncbi:MAG: AbrB/MazE/SpoVT family DNA-binding domain-containing protein [Anaerolineae bacterium]|nr:AbrB/MazE/SpoVT family DNA-binding domain-containing protein [Anaerolineae bacterium]